MKNYIARFLPVTAGLTMQFLILTIMVANESQNLLDTHSFLSHSLLLDAFNQFSLNNITLSLLK